MDAPVVSVIVLNRDGRAWLPSCVDALAAQAGAPPFEVIVADNASTDGSIDVLARTHPQVRIVRNGANLGFAGGNNAAARAARGELFVFLNNDTVTEPDWLARLHGAFVAHPEFALVTSRIVFLADPSVVDSAGDGYLLAGGAFKRGHQGPTSAVMESEEVFGACGAAFLIRRDVFETLGGFDESFFLVYEDVDLSYRARLLGYRCWYAADAVVRHAGSASMGRMSPQAVFCGQRNLEWTWIKNTPAALLIRTAPAHVVYSIAGIAYYARRGLLGPALKGKCAALTGLPAVLRRRRAVQSARVADPSAFMDGGWIAAKRREKHAGH
jgi:N-acetylglucosaminyl-diphospho-decaprenol L-rhamnosyltransferase